MPWSASSSPSRVFDMPGRRDCGRKRTSISRSMPAAWSSATSSAGSRRSYPIVQIVGMRAEIERLRDELVGAPAGAVVVRDRDDDRLVGAVGRDDLLDPRAHRLGRADDAPAATGRGGVLLE